MPAHRQYRPHTCPRWGPRAQAAPPGRCLACDNQYAAQQYARTRLTRQTLRRFLRLEELKAMPLEGLTPAQRRAVLQSACLPWEKVCGRCWEAQDRRAFPPYRRNRDGRYTYCHRCCRTPRKGR